MFIELIATIFAGLGGVGVVLWLRLVTLNRVPKWCLPLGAGLAMLVYQIMNEYTWYSHQQSLLPDHVQVVNSVESRSWWRPWSMAMPQTLRFIVADFGNAEQNSENSKVFKVDLYVMERRKPTVRIVTVIDCTFNARADYSHDLEFPDSRNDLPSEWFSLDSDDRMLGVCPKGESL